jgi:ABC-type transport system substrate-binding protein
MKNTTLTRRTVLRTAALATTALASPFVRGARAAATVFPKGKMVLAWHTNIAARWLDPQQHDGTASGDNFLMALQDALIKNFREVRYDHPALAERYEFAEDATSATFRLRPGIKFHDGSPVTPEDVKWSYEHYRGAWSEVLHERPRGSRSSTIAPSGSTSTARFSIFRSCSVPPMCAAPAGLSRRSTMRRSDRTGSCKNRLAPGLTSSSRSNRE